MRTAVLEAGPQPDARQVEPQPATLATRITVGRRQLTDLAVRTGNGAHVSLYLPRPQPGRHAAETTIRWKNLLARAEAAVRDAVPAPDADATLAALHQVAASHRVTAGHRPWRTARSGLAVFAAADRAESFAVPGDLPELAAVGHRFLITPLVHAVVPDGPFLLLALDRSRARLFTGTRAGLEEADWLPLPSGPGGSSEEDGRSGDRPERFVADRGSAGMRAVFYGRGDVAQREAEQTLRYFRAVDALLPRELGGARPPLVLAGLGHLVAQYRQVTRFPEVLAGDVATAVSQLPVDQLHRRVWPLIDAHLRRAELDAAARYGRLAGTGRTVSDPHEVLRAARAGRLDALFVSSSLFRVPGSAAPHVLHLASSRLGTADAAAAACLAHGGEIYVVAPEHMPLPTRQNATAALLRY